VLYQHFASMEDIVEAVAVEGFAELGEALRAARRGGGGPEAALRRVVHAYSKFAAANPVLYDAMFTRATRLRFAAVDSPPQLKAGFAALREAVANVAGGGDVDTLTELLWAALHGLTTLGRSGRLRTARDRERIELLIAQFSAPPRQGP